MSSEFQHSESDSLEPSDSTGSSGKILLGDIPDRPSRRSIAPVESVPVPVDPYVSESSPSMAVDFDERPSGWRAVKNVVGRGFFDPFLAFGSGVDWERFSRAQLFLFAISLVGPFAFLLVFSIFSAILYQIGAALNSVTPPNPFYELALYPLAYLFAKGYWVAYLVLPMSIFILGWIWAGMTAWNIARDSDADVKEMFCVLAMLGSMFASFTMFPFLRLLALGFLILYMSRRMNQHFDISIMHLARRGGIFLVGMVVFYTWFERKVESCYAVSSEMSTNVNDFYFKNKKLEWPAFRVKKITTANQLLLQNLWSLDSGVREKAIVKALSVISNNAESLDARFALALRIADLGNVAGMVYASKAYQSGQGVPVDNAQALLWMHNASVASPRQLEYGLDEANLLFLNKRILDGKRRFVNLAKSNIDSLDEISSFIRKQGYGLPEYSIAWEVERLYRQNHVSGTMTYRYTCYYGDIYSEELNYRAELLQKLNSLDRDGTQWFYRALITEFGSESQASAEIYGESSAESEVDEFNKKIEMNDPGALLVLGDRSFDGKDLVKARSYWLKAAMSLNSDKRRVNARIYLKLAESYDPAIVGAGHGNAREASRFYLGYLLLAEYSGASNGKTLDALKTLGVVVDKNVDVSSFSYVSLCAKYDIPEAWAILGSYYVGGQLEGARKNPAKARECFQKAKGLGYQGPVVSMRVGDEGSASK